MAKMNLNRYLGSRTAMLKLRFLREHLARLSSTVQDSAVKLRYDVDSLGYCVTLVDDLRNLFGTDVSVFLRTAKTEAGTPTSGQTDTTDTPTRKPRKDSKEQKDSQAPRPVSTSTRSTRKPAKRARIGERSKAPLAWGEKIILTDPKLKRQARRMFSAKRSRIIRNIKKARRKK
jgi:hypothetical protein